MTVGGRNMTPLPLVLREGADLIALDEAPEHGPPSEPGSPKTPAPLRALTKVEEIKVEVEPASAKTPGALRRAKSMRNPTTGVSVPGAQARPAAPCSEARRSEGAINQSR